MLAVTTSSNQSGGVHSAGETSEPGAASTATTGKDKLEPESSSATGIITKLDGSD